MTQALPRQKIYGVTRSVNFGVFGKFRFLTLIKNFLCDFILFVCSLKTKNSKTSKFTEEEKEIRLTPGVKWGKKAKAAPSYRKRDRLLTKPTGRLVWSVQFLGLFTAPVKSGAENEPRPQTLQRN